MAPTHLHSIPIRDEIGPCEVTGRRAHPRLQRYVVGYGGFRSAGGGVVAHRVLPLNLVTVIIELDGTSRLVTGPRIGPALFERSRWGADGVSIGLTPAGAAALLGARMGELAHAEARLEDLLGPRDAELAERLAEAPDQLTRFALLDECLIAWLGSASESASASALTHPTAPTPTPTPDEATLRAWWRLQRSANRPRISTLAAELGISRRALESRFQQHIGLSPVSVARVTRFQRAVGMLARHCDLPRTALECGYADQSHFTREIRAMAGLTPTRLRAFIQYREQAAR